MVFVGTAGYRFVEGWSWLEALYMTVITLTTVGFGEINPLSPAGRFFTILVIIGGVGLAAYALSFGAEVIATGELARMIRTRRKVKLKDHCIVCGFGRVGRYVAAELERENIQFVVIDKEDSAIEICQQKNYPFVQGNAAEEETLRQAGIASAKFLVASVNADAENVFIILTVRELREDLFIIARCNFEESTPKLKKAGANQVISPYALTGHRIVHMISRPSITEFLDVVLHSENTELWLEEIDIQSGSILANQTLGDARIRNEMGVTVLAIDLPQKKVITHPKADTVLLEGARLIVLGTRDQLKNLHSMAISQVKDAV